MAGEFDAAQEAKTLVQLAQNRETTNEKYISNMDNAAYAKAADDAGNRFFDELNSLSYRNLTAVAAADQRIKLDLVPAGTGTATMKTAEDCLRGVSVNYGTDHRGVLYQQIIKCDKK